MDRQLIVLFIPIMALAIPVLAIISSGAQKVARLRFEQMQAHGGGNPEELQELRDELQNVRRELGELQELVDFSERMLAQVRNPNQIAKESKPQP